MSSANRLDYSKQDDTPARLLGLIDNLEPKIKRSFLQAITLIKSEHTLDVLEDLIARGQIAEALAVTNRAIVNIANTIADGYVAAGQSTSTLIAGQLAITLNFDQLNDRAINNIRNNRFQLIREFTQEQTRATQSALLDGVTRGANPRQQARAFVDSIGLTERQQAAVNNYRRLLNSGSTEALSRRLRDRRFDSTVRNAALNDVALTADQVDNMVSRYAQRYVRYRSEVIARTEALRAVHQGAEEAWQQAIENDVVAQDKIRRTWNNAGDDRVRDSHDAMQGQVRSEGDPFETAAGNALMFPGDPAAPAEEIIQCRCVVTRRIDA